MGLWMDPLSAVRTPPQPDPVGEVVGDSVVAYVVGGWVVADVVGGWVVAEVVGGWVVATVEGKKSGLLALENQ